MKKLTKLLFTSLVFLAISLSSCNKGDDFWNYSDEDIFNAIELETTVQMDEKLHVSIHSEDAFFKHNINKDSILVVPKVSEGSGEEGNITFDDLKRERIENFSFRLVDNKNIVVTLDDYSSPAYYIYIDKNATLDNKFAQATISLYINDDNDPVFSLDNSSFYAHASNPTFIIRYSNASINEATISNVELGDAFSSLDINKINDFGNRIAIETSGEILEDNQGLINLKEGFFKDINKDVSFVSGILFNVAYVEQSSYTFNDNKLSFDLKSVYLPFEKNVNNSSVTFSDKNHLASIDFLSYKNRNTLSLTLSLSEEYNSINNALEELNEADITLHDVFENVDGEFSIKFNVSFPELNIFPKLIKSDQMIYFTVYLRHALDIELTLDDIEFFDSNLIFDGEDKNAEILNFASNPSDLFFAIKTNDKFADEQAYGKLRLNFDKVKTLWNTGYSVFESFDSSNVVSQDWSDKDIDTHVEQILSTSAAPIVHKSLLSLGYLGAAFLAVSNPEERNLSAGLSSLLSIFQLWGFTSAGEPSISDVLGKLNQIEGEVKGVAQQLDNFSQLMQKEMLYVEYGINSIAFEQYKSEWVDFNRQYVEKLDSLKRAIQTKYRNRYVEKIREIDEYLDIRLYYQLEDGAPKITVIDPSDPYMSIEGKEIKKSHRVRIPASYMQPLIDEVKNNAGYTKNVEALFDSCVTNFLKDNESIAARVNVKDIKAAFESQTNADVVTKEDASEYNNAFINYANEISGNNPAKQSALQNYFNMMECYFNFQAEAANFFKKFRAQVTLELEEYATLDNDLRVYTGCDWDLDEFNSSYLAADKYLKEHDNIYSVPVGASYSYVAHSAYYTEFIKAHYAVYYENNAGKKVFTKSFTILNADTGLEASYINADNLITQNQFFSMYNRFTNVYASKLIENCPNNFIDYCISYGGLEKDCRSKYKTQRDSSTTNGRQFPDAKVPVITSLEGSDVNLTEESFSLKCVDALDTKSSYFKKDSVYSYYSAGEKGKAENKYWSGKEAKGTIIDLENVSLVTNVINRYAMYSESHGGWIHDENFLFEQYGGGLYAYVFYKA